MLHKIQSIPHKEHNVLLFGRPLSFKPCREIMGLVSELRSTALLHSE